jgi:hypothetical protein
MLASDSKKKLMKPGRLWQRKQYKENMSQELIHSN